MKTKFNGITVHAVGASEGRGFFYANSKDREKLAVVAAITETLPEVERAEIEFVPELVLTRKNGTGRITGGYRTAIRLHRRSGYNCGVYRQDGTEIRERPYQVLPEGV